MEHRGMWIEDVEGICSGRNCSVGIGDSAAPAARAAHLKYSREQRLNRS